MMSAKFNPGDAKVIMGLGNPDREHEKTYHNVGILFVDFILDKFSSKTREVASTPEFDLFEICGLSSRAESKGRSREISLRGMLKRSLDFARDDGMFVARSKVYMNDSGKAVGGVLKYLKIGPEELLLVHDDTDILIGSYKIVFGRGSAGHKGVESVISVLESKEFGRLRIGMRSGVERTRKRAQDFILKNIPKKSVKVLECVFETIIAQLL